MSPARVARNFDSSNARLKHLLVNKDYLLFFKFPLTNWRIIAIYSQMTSLQNFLQICQLIFNLSMCDLIWNDLRNEEVEHRQKHSRFPSAKSVIVCGLWCPSVGWDFPKAFRKVRLSSLHSANFSQSHHESVAALSECEGLPPFPSPKFRSRIWQLFARNVNAALWDEQCACACRVLSLWACFLPDFMQNWCSCSKVFRMPWACNLVFKCYTRKAIDFLYEVHFTRRRMNTLIDVGALCVSLSLMLVFCPSIRKVNLYTLILDWLSTKFLDKGARR